MIPVEVAEIADLLCPCWAELPDEDDTYFWLLLAQKIYDAGYRKQKDASLA